MFGGRKVRSNKGKKRGPRTGLTRSGKRFRSPARGYVRKTSRKTRSNKGKKRGPRVARRSASPRRSRSVRRSRSRSRSRSARRSRTVTLVARKKRKTRSNKGKKRGPRTGKTRSGKRFRGGGYYNPQGSPY